MLVVSPLTSRGCPNPVGDALGIHLTSAEYNMSTMSLFRDHCSEEGNEGLQAHLDDLHKATMVFLVKLVADRAVWKGYPEDLLANHHDENGKLRTPTAGV